MPEGSYACTSYTHTNLSYAYIYTHANLSYVYIYTHTYLNPYFTGVLLHTLIVSLTVVNVNTVVLLNKFFSLLYRYISPPQHLHLQSSCCIHTEKQFVHSAIITNTFASSTHFSNIHPFPVSSILFLFSFLPIHKFYPGRHLIMSTKLSISHRYTQRNIFTLRVVLAYTYRLLSSEILMYTVVFCCLLFLYLWCVCVYIYIYIYIYICIYMGKTGNKSNSMKMNKDEKTQGLQKTFFFFHTYTHTHIYGHHYIYIYIM